MPEEQVLKRKRADVARAERRGDVVYAERARSDYYEAKLSDQIRRIVDKAPPFTDEQQARLSALFTATRDGHLVDRGAQS